MREAAAPATDLLALSPAPRRGTAAGRQPEAAAPAPGAPPAPAAAAVVSADQDEPAGGNDLVARVHAAAGGLAPLVAQAESVRAERARAHGAPRWTDVFTTQFTEFSNRPR